MKQLLEDLKNASTERKRLRKTAIKILRNHKEHFMRNGNYWIVRKMNNNYMTDLSDLKLMSYLEYLDRTQNLNKKKHRSTFNFNKDNIVL